MEDGRWVTLKDGRRIYIRTTNDYMNDKIRNDSKKVSGKKYQLTDDNIQQVIDESISQWDDNYARLYMSKIKPEDFLELTAPDVVLDMLNANKTELDLEKIKGAKYVADMMYLDIDLETGQVRGHEGRHRMLALKDAGYDEVDIVVFPYNYEKYNAKEYKDFKIKGQDRLSNREKTLSTLVPVSKANQERIKKRDY